MSTKTLPRKAAQKYFTTSEAADYLRVSGDTIRAAIDAGHLRAKYTAGTDPETGKRRPGGVFLYTAAALDAWYDALEDA